MTLTIDSKNISLEEIISATDIVISEDKTFKKTIAEAHDFLMEQIKTKPIYGITTGYGASGKNYVSYEDSQTYKKTCFDFMAVG